MGEDELRMIKRIPEPSEEHHASDVRPYTLTGGRTRSTVGELPMETLVESLAPPTSGRTPEERDILALAATGYTSIAELSAHTRLPMGVVRVLAGDLELAGLLYVPGFSTANEAPSALSATTLLESVLDGICAL